LKFEGDKRFFTAALDRADLIVHGRHSHEGQPNSPRRTRIILTPKGKRDCAQPVQSKATLWNPAGSCVRSGVRFCKSAFRHVAVIGGPYVFGMFMDRYHAFWLSRRRTCASPAASPASPVCQSVHRRRFSPRTA
jgi:hypothetical protein